MQCKERKISSMELEDDSSPPSPPLTDEKVESLGETTGFDQSVVENSRLSDAGNHAEEDVGSVGQIVENKDNKSESPPSLPAKGYGLKKWRRIRRDFTKEGPNTVDLSKILKRGPPNAAEPSKFRDSAGDMKLIREGSVATADSSIKSTPFTAGLFTASKGSGSDSRLAMGYAAFPFGTDSDNSGDRSSKSSTAASAPKMRFISPIAMGSARDKNKVKSTNGKSSGNSVQRSQLARVKIESSKKLRGANVNKDASYSSVESDLRSSTMAFAEVGNFSGIANGIRREGSMNYDGENSCEAQASDQQSNDDVYTTYFKDNGGDSGYISHDDEANDISWEAKEEESDSQRTTIGWDPLVESIIALQDVQEALEKEIQKFGEIGKQPLSLDDDYASRLGLTAEFGSVNSEIHELNSSGQLEKGSLPSETELVKTSQKVHILDRKLEDALAMLQVKESRIIELENIFNESKLANRVSGSSLPSLQEERREMEIELEVLYRQRIEAEVECLAMSRTSQKLKVASDDQNTLFEEQKYLIGGQSQILHHLRDEEKDMTVLKNQVNTLGSSGDAAKVIKMRNGVYKLALFAFIQLLFVVGLFLFPNSDGAEDPNPT